MSTVKSELLKEAFVESFKRDVQYQALCAVEGEELPVVIYDEFKCTDINEIDGTAVFQATVLFQGREFCAAMGFYLNALPIEIRHSIGMKVDNKELLSSLFNAVVQKPF